MAEIAVLAGESRSDVGKGAARAARRAGRLPGIVYGGKDAPIAVTLEYKALNREYQQGGFFSRLFDLKLGTESVRVLPRDVQLHPVTDNPLHVDFLRLSGETLVNVAVVVIFQNEEESPGLKQGGVLNIVRREIELRCRADAIPESIFVDLTGRMVGDSIHISSIDLPDGAQPTISDRDFTIATIAAPTIVVEPTTEEEEEGVEEITEEEGTEESTEE